MSKYERVVTHLRSMIQSTTSRAEAAHTHHHSPPMGPFRVSEA